MCKSRTLYVSDLDGTLLNRAQALSDFTVQTLNALVDQGMLFSYATARSYVTAAKATAGLSPAIPVIVYNGTFVLENGTQKKLVSHYFDPSDARRILTTLTEHGVYPFVYSYIDGRERFSYSPAHMTKGLRDFHESRRGDVRDNPVEVGELYNGEIFYFTCIDAPEKLFPLYERLRDVFQCLYYTDPYSREQWLEISPKQATKANAIMELKRLLGCDRVICFGDGVNDLSMFDIADECYAVENADDDLKRKATAVIGSNEHDGVAAWLQENFGEKRQGLCP